MNTNNETNTNTAAAPWPDPGAGYRLLREGEEIIESDEWWFDIEEKWLPREEAVGVTQSARMCATRRRVAAPAAPAASDTPRTDAIKHPCACGNPECHTTSVDDALSFARTLERELNQARAADRSWRSYVTEMCEAAGMLTSGDGNTFITGPDTVTPV